MSTSMSTSFKPELDPNIAISNGDIKGFQHFAQFGYNNNLAAGVEANLWSGPTALYVFPDDNGEAMEMVSDNVADNQTLLIQALDENWDQVNIPLALNGTTPVALPLNVARINRSGNQDTGVIFRYRRRDFGSIFGTGARFGLNKRGNSVATLIVENVAPLPPKSDVILLAESDQGATDVSARLPFTLYEA